MATFTYVRGFTATHKGIDLGAPRGTPIRAVAGGQIAYGAYEPADPRAPWYARGGGNVVHVDVGGGQIHQYAHLDRLGVRTGQAIAAGGFVGTVGSTGAGLPGQPVTGPHLHFAIYDRARLGFIDPTRVISIAGLIAAVSGSRLIEAPAASGLPLTFWGVVTYPEGHILTASDVPAIMDKLRAAGYFRDDASGLAQIAVSSLLESMVGRRWDDQLARDIQRGLGIGAGAVARELPSVLPFGDEIAQAIAGFGSELGNLLGRAGAFVVLAVFVLVGAYLLVTSK